ncbi:hypothetical protein QMK28_08275, partial [Streptomyces sp. H27-D2]|nr:hypothetical protein [Streptomyces sp. H27-D2]
MSSAPEQQPVQAEGATRNGPYENRSRHSDEEPGRTAAGAVVNGNRLAGATKPSPAVRPAGPRQPGGNGHPPAALSPRLPPSGG